MEALLIYYNPNHNCFYLKIVNSLIFDKHVGDTNKFDHILIQVLIKNNNKLINCNDFWDYIKKTRDKKDISTKNKVINKIICLLDKIKD